MRTMIGSFLAALLLAAGFALPVRAEEGAALDGAALYAQRTCIACHGVDAMTPILPEYPKLAGQSEAYALRQMRDIKSGARNNGNTAAMAGVMHLVTDEEMQILAAYIAGLAKCP